MEILADILKITIPGLLVLLTALLLLNRMIKNDQEKESRN
jgi:hypothetical protein